MFGLTPFNRRQSDITRRNDIFDMRSIFDDFFTDSMLPGFFTQGHPIKADIRESEKEYIVEAEIPGARKEDIRLELRDDVLTVGIQHNEEVKEEKENYIRRERRSGSYSRSFHVENVRNEGVTAKYTDGILTVTLPKDEHGKQNRHSIEIQ